MTRKTRSLLILVSLAMIVLFAASEVFARVGGGRTSGSRGTRSYSTPASPLTSPSSPPRSTTPPPAAAPTPLQSAPQPAGGGFLRGLAGGIAGGFLGSMLFGGMGGGMGGFGGSGFGLIEILLLGGLGFLAYRFFKGRRRQEEQYVRQPRFDPQPGAYGGQSVAQGPAAQEDPRAGLAHIAGMDPSFNERALCDTAMDIFFKIQGAWMNRDLSSASRLLTDEMKGILQGDVSEAIAAKRINRLENIAVRNVEVTEAWQESGQDFVTVLFQANLLDYTTDESGNVLAGSKVDPVKFEEFWTFVRPVGNNPWRLSAINQAG